MTGEEKGDFLDHLYEATIRPDRFDALILEWDARLAETGEDLDLRLADFRSETFLRHVERAITILDEINSFEFQELNGHLAAIPNPAVVFASGGAVVASNEAARTGYGLYPGGSVRSTTIEPEEQLALVHAVGRISHRAGGEGEILSLRASGGRRGFRLHLRPLEGARGRRHVLMVSSEIPWSEAVGRVFCVSFGLTEAEVGIVRRLLAGATVGDIARDTGRRESTIRSQIHAILAKTGTENQAEILRLAGLLQTSLTLDPGQGLRQAVTILAEPPSREISLPDGRRLTVLRFGDPRGRTVIWLQSQLGFFTPTRTGEADMRRLGIRAIVPVRAGYGTSDTPPSDRDILEVAVDDTLAVMTALGIDRAPVVALVDDIWIALALARRAPERVAAVLGIGAGFPVTRPEHYRRLHPVGRFFRACARHAPHLVPFLLRLIRARMIRSGLDSHARANLRSPADIAAMNDPEIFDAWMAGFTYLYSTGRAPEAALCAELRRFHRDWPPDLGDVACRVTLLHGEEDGNNPYETAREMAEAYPAWRFIACQEVGQLALYTCWDRVLSLLCQMLEDAAVRPLPSPPQGRKMTRPSLDG